MKHWRQVWTNEDDDVLAFVGHETWVHEQDNLKVALDADGVPAHVVAHESGVNEYERIEMDAVDAAVEYWAFYETAWHDVRAAWAPILARERFTLQWRNGEERLDGLVDFAIDLDDADARRDVLERLVSFVVE